MSTEVETAIAELLDEYEGNAENVETEQQIKQRWARRICAAFYIEKDRDWELHMHGKRERPKLPKVVNEQEEELRLNPSTFSAIRQLEYLRVRRGYYSNGTPRDVAM